MNCNLLILGGTGFIGTALITQLKKYISASKIFVLGQNDQKLLNLENEGITGVKGKLENLSLIESIIERFDIKTVVHLVSNLIPASNSEEFNREYQEVVLPTIKLINYCSRKNIKFVFFSSGGTVYGNLYDSVPIKENFETSPISYYGKSKKCIEDHIVREHEINNLQYLVLRPSNAYGPGQNIYGEQGLIGVAIRKTFHGETLSVWGDGNCIRDYIYVKDLSYIAAKLILDNVKNRTINISSGIGFSVNEIIDTICETTGKTIAVRYLPLRKSDVASIVLDNTLMNQFVSVELTPLKFGIKEFYEYERAAFDCGN